MEKDKEFEAEQKRKEIEDRMADKKREADQRKLQWKQSELREKEVQAADPLYMKV